MGNVTSYNASDCIITVGDVHITQLGEDMVSFEKQEALFEPRVGAQGDVIKNEINNGLYNLTITIQPTSPQKNYLIGLANSREEVEVWVNNPKLGEKFGGSKACIQEMPSLSRGTEAEDMEITFCVFDGVITDA